MSYSDQNYAPQTLNINSIEGDLDIGGKLTVGETLDVTGITTLSDDVEMVRGKKLRLDSDQDTPGMYIVDAAGVMEFYVGNQTILQIYSSQFAYYKKLATGSPNALDIGSNTTYGFRTAYLNTSLVLGLNDNGQVATTGGLIRASRVIAGGAGNQAGADLRIQAGVGRGNGTVGKILLQTPRVQASGDTEQTAATLVTIDEDNVGVAGKVTLDEMTAPTGVANKAVIFAQDNGSGKTQLMVIFGTGAAQQVAIEP